MTRQEALHELYTIFGYGFYNERVDEALNMAIKALEQEPKWIPCSERLPKRDELVLVSYKNTNEIHLCKYFEDDSENPWWTYIDDCCAWNNVVFAWMPLPEAYREDEQ